MPSTLLRPRVIAGRTGQPWEQRFLDLRGGLNDSVSDELIEDNELSAVRNYIVDIFSGVVIEREGITKTLADAQAEAFTSIYDGVSGNYFTTSTKIKLFDNTTIATVTSSTDPSWASMNGVDIIADGVNNPAQVNGTTRTDLTGTPVLAKAVIEYAQMLFFIGHNGGHLNWTTEFTIQPFVAANDYVLSNNSDNDGIGFCKYSGYLFVFLQQQFHQIRATTSANIEVVFSNFEDGALSHRSIVPTPYGIFFWTQNGIAVTDGQSIRYPMLEKCPNLLSGLNRAKDSLVHASWNPNKRRVQFYLFNGSSTTQNLALYYYPVSGTFWPGNGAGTNMAASAKVKVSGVVDVYIGSAATNGYLYQNIGASDDGTAVSSYLETKRFHTEYGPIAVKRLRDSTLMLLVTTDISIDFAIYYDNATTIGNRQTLTISGISGFQLGTDTLDLVTGGILGAGTESKDESVQWNTKFTKLKFRIENTSVNRIGIRGILCRGILITA